MQERAINLGFTDKVLAAAARYPELFLGRVIAQYKDLYKVAVGKTELLAEITGKLRYASEDMSDYPGVGDFVMMDRVEAGSGNAIIHHILTRKSMFVRRAAGTSHDIQVVAANIDTVFICMSLNNDFNLRRLERYLSIAWDSGAVPVVVLTKADLCQDLPERLLEVKRITVGVDLLVTSSMTTDGYKDILKYIIPGKTVAFIGSSGVGKSTLINRLMGKELLATQELRSDDKGKHTTTRRELLLIPGGGAVIDTPGMRELGLESADLAKSFSDIDKLTQLCRFKNCRHEQEPGCAVRQAIADGEIDEERLQNYIKLQKEAKYEKLNSRQIEKEKLTEMFSEFGGIKNARDYVKSKKH